MTLSVASLLVKYSHRHEFASHRLNLYVFSPWESLFLACDVNDKPTDIKRAGDVNSYKTAPPNLRNLVCMTLSEGRRLKAVKVAYA